MPRIIFKLIVIVSCIFNHLLFAQTIHPKNSDLRPITLVTVSKDTIRGSIAYGERFKSYKAILVKAGTDIRWYQPKDVYSFVITEKEETLYFKTMITEGEYSSDDYSKLTSSPEIKLTKDTVFAQLLLQGARSVYKYTDQVVFKKHYLVETEDGKATDLIYKKYYTSENKAAVNYNSEYKKQLMLLLASPVVTAARVSAVKFQRKDIVALVKLYNSNTSANGSVLYYEYKDEKAKVQFGVAAGVNLTSFKFKGNDRDFVQMQFGKSVGFTGGLQLNIVLPQTKKKWSFYNQLLYSNYELKLVKPYTYFEDKYSYKKLTAASIQASYIKLYTGARYQLPLPATFIQFGMMNGYSFKNSTQADFESYFYSIYSKESGPWIKFRNYERSFFTGLGWMYNKVGIELRGEIGNGFSDKRNIVTRFMYGYLLLNYMF